MAGGETCAFPSDFGSYTSLTLQVNNSTNSIYSNLYLSVPVVSPGIAELTSATGPIFWLAGTLEQGCNRESPLCTVVNDNEYCVAISPNSAGRAAVETLENLDSSSAYWESLTSAFYVDAALDPFSLWIPNAGSYYGTCRDCDENGMLLILRSVYRWVRGYRVVLSFEHYHHTCRL